MEKGGDVSYRRKWSVKLTLIISVFLVLVAYIFMGDFAVFLLPVIFVCGVSFHLSRWIANKMFPSSSMARAIVAWIVLIILVLILTPLSFFLLNWPTNT